MRGGADGAPGAGVGDAERQPGADARAARATSARTRRRTGAPLRLTNSAGYSLAAVELGTGPQAVVLAHQSEGSLCEWLPFGQVLADKGYRVLAFDFAGAGSSTQTKQKTYVEDIRTGVAYLRDNGVTKIAVMGASMGATMSVVAAAAIAPPVDGVIALSPPVDFDGVNAEKAAPSLRHPALYIAGDTDGDFATYAEAIYAATPADDRAAAGRDGAAARHPDPRRRDPGDDQRPQRDRAVPRRAPRAARARPAPPPRIAPIMTCGS